MRHDIERLRTEIEKFHDAPPPTGDLDLDDYFLVHAFIQPRCAGPLHIEVNRGDGEYELELVAAHAFMQPRYVLLEWAKVLGPTDLWPARNAYLDLAAVTLAPQLPEPLRDTGRIVPGHSDPQRPSWAGGRSLAMAFSVREVTPIDLVLVFDRFPLTTPKI